MRGCDQRTDRAGHYQLNINRRSGPDIPSSACPNLQAIIILYPSRILSIGKFKLWYKFWKGHILLVKTPSENENFYAEH